MSNLKTKKRRLKFAGREKMLYTFGLISFIAFFAVQVFFVAQTSNMKMNIKQTTARIDRQEKMNESLTMQVNELTAYENVSTVIKELGLGFNNENIIVINR